MSVWKLVSKKATWDKSGRNERRASMAARLVSSSSSTRSLMLLEPTSTARMFTLPTLPDDFEWGGTTCGPGSAGRCRVTLSDNLHVRFEAVQIPVVEHTRRVYRPNCITASESVGFSGSSTVAPDPW